MQGIVIGAGDTCVIEKYNFYDAFTSYGWIRWNAFLLGLQQDSNSNHAAVLWTLNSLLHIGGLRGREKKQRPLLLLLWRGTINWPVVGQDWYLALLSLQELRTILYPPKGISCIKHVKHQCVCVGGGREEEICVWKLI